MNICYNGALQVLTLGENFVRRILPGFLLHLFKRDIRVVEIVVGDLVGPQGSIISIFFGIVQW